MKEANKIGIKCLIYYLLCCSEINNTYMIILQKMVLRNTVKPVLWYDFIEINNMLSR
jgi:hypothetical protein